MQGCTDNKKRSGDPILELRIPSIPSPETENIKITAIKGGWFKKAICGIFGSEKAEDNNPDSKAVGHVTEPWSVIRDIFPMDDKAVVARLHAMLAEKDAAIAALQQEIHRLSNDIQSSTKVARREHPMTPVIHVVEDGGATIQNRIGRHASVSTSNVLSNIPTQRTDELCPRMINMFKAPLDFVDYLKSPRFARDILRLAKRACPIFENEPRCLFLQSPAYVFGDIHGNLEDLNFFADNIWKLGVPLTAGRFLFLGDYVDRGMSGLECIAYLLALKIQNPEKIYMLRGNHELRDVNGWEEHYGERSFLWQCRDRFGEEMGARVWEEVNQVFDRLPLCGVIDHDIFCVHGGIPRPIPGSNNRVQDILMVPSVAGVNPPNELETFETQQVASDCLWSDPARGDQERYLDETGFGESLRGGGAICFGQKAIEDFLEQNQLSYIVRGHEAHAEGVSISKGARVFTVFSTSKDHGQGNKAMAGCILVDFDQIQVINRSVRYKNKFVHKRNSISLAGLSGSALDLRAKLGLVVSPEHTDEGEEEDEDYENGNDDKK